MADSIKTKSLPLTGSSRSVMKTMILFSIAMCVLPITTYFMSKAVIFEGILGLPHQSSYFYAAISSIVVVHIILGLFIYVAFTEDSKPIAEFNKRD